MEHVSIEQSVLLVLEVILPDFTPLATADVCGGFAAKPNSNII